MHGLDTWPVIIIEYLGKETTSSGDHLLRGRGQTHTGKIAAKIHGWDNGPLRKSVGDAVSHFSRRSTCVCHTQNAIGHRTLK